MGICCANFMPISNHCARKRAPLCPLAKSYQVVITLAGCLLLVELAIENTTANAIPLINIFYLFILIERVTFVFCPFELIMLPLIY